MVPDKDLLTVPSVFTSLEPVTQSKAPTDKKTKRKRMSPSSKPEASKIVKQSPHKEQATNSQPAEDQWLPLTSPREEDHDMGMDSNIVSMGDVKFEDLSINDAESHFDIESEIRVTDPNVLEVKTISGSLNIIQEADDLEKADFDLVSLPDNTIESIDGLDALDLDMNDNVNSETKENLTKSEEALSDHLLDELDKFVRTKNAPLVEFAAKNVDSDPLGHLHKETSSLTTKKQLSKALKIKIRSSIRTQVKKGIKRVSNRLKYCTEKNNKNSIHTKELIDLIQHMVYLLKSAQVFRKANAKGEKWEKTNPDLNTSDPNQGEHS
nr:hypothetical protein [Tanacetum cinerariifolium]